MGRKEHRQGKGLFILISEHRVETLGVNELSCKHPLIGLLQSFRPRCRDHLLGSGRKWASFWCHSIFTPSAISSRAAFRAGAYPATSAAAITATGSPSRKRHGVAQEIVQPKNETLMTKLRIHASARPPQMPQNKTNKHKICASHH